MFASQHRLPEFQRTANLGLAQSRHLTVNTSRMCRRRISIKDAEPGCFEGLAFMRGPTEPNKW
jgi:hypothetical protein